MTFWGREIRTFDKILDHTGAVVKGFEKKMVCKRSAKNEITSKEAIETSLEFNIPNQVQKNNFIEAILLK